MRSRIRMSTIDIDKEVLSIDFFAASLGCHVFVYVLLGYIPEFMLLID